MTVKTTKFSIRIVRQEAGFDKACDMAYEQACDLFNWIDDDTIIVKFNNYKHTGNMGGQEYIYTFRTWIKRHADK